MKERKSSVSDSESSERINQRAVTIKNIQQLSNSLVEKIARLTLKSMAKTEALADVCKRISTTLNANCGGKHNWICMASIDPNMSGYLFKCQGYTQYMVDNYYFLVACTSN